METFLTSLCTFLLFNHCSRCIKKPILGKFSTTPFEKIKNPKVVIYIKPWDDEVFASFLTLLKYIQENQCRAKIDCFVEKWLYDMVKESDAATQLGITLDSLRIFDNKDDELKCKINYLLTLGGDGTILYAAKQFPGDYIPLIVSFALVSLFLM